MTGKRPSRAAEAARWPAALLALAALALAGRTAPAALPPFEELIPPGAVLYVAVRDLPDLLERVRQSPRYALLSEPEMQGFLDQITAELERPRGELARMLGRDPEELKDVLGGQAALAALPRGDRDAHFLLLADVSADPELADAVLSSMLDHLRQQDEHYTVHEEEFRGRTVYRLEPLETPAEALPEQERGPTEMGQPRPRRRRPRRRLENPGFITLDGGVLAVASSPDRSLLEKHLVLRSGGDVAALHESAGYRRLRPHLDPERDLTVFVDLKAAGASPADELLPVEGTVSPDAVPAFGFGMTLRQEGVATQGMMLAPAPRQGLLRAFEPGRGGVLPPPYVGEDAAVFAGMHFSLSVFWEEMKAALQRESPRQYAMLQQQLQMMPIDVENDLFGAIGSRWFIYARIGGEGGEDLSLAAVADLQNAEALRTAFTQMVAGLPPFIQVDTVDFMGVDLYSFRANRELQAQGAAAGPQFCTAVMQDKFIYAGDLELAKAIVRDSRRNASPLLESAPFRRLLDRTMDEPDGLVLVDGRALGRWMASRMEEMRQAAARAMERAGHAAEGPDLPEPPPWDVLRKYETSTLLTVRWVDDGLLFKAWAPEPVLDE
jgi:hypothetical protein